MRAQRNAYKMCLTGYFITLIVCIVIYFFPKGLIKCTVFSGNSNFYFTLVSGVCASFFVTFLSSFILYKCEMAKIIVSCICDLYWIKITLNTIEGLLSEEWDDYDCMAKEYMLDNLLILEQQATSFRHDWRLQELQENTTLNKIGERIDEIIKFAKREKRQIKIGGIKRSYVESLDFEEIRKKINDSLEDFISTYPEIKNKDDYMKKFVQDIDLSKH